jgi:hypothetical protein
MLARWVTAVWIGCAGAAMAQSALQNAPIYDFGANPYSQTSSVPSFTARVHGFVSAGVATHGGNDLAAGVTVPLIPGQLSVSVSGDKGQVGGLAHAPGGPSRLQYSEVNAQVNLRVNDDFSASVGVSSTNLRGPVAVVP